MFDLGDIVEVESELTLLHVLPIENEYKKYLSDAKYIPVREYFHVHRFFIKDTNQNSRVISHWCALGLLDDNRDKGDASWKQFTIIELVWIKVLMELRSIGLSLEKLRHSYKTMFKAKTSTKNSMLEFGIFQALTGSKVYLVILPESGAMDVMIDDDLVINIFKGDLLKHHYIQLNLFECMKNIGSDDDYFTDLINMQNTPDIDAEQKIIELIRSKQHDEIKIIMKNGEVHRVAKTNKKIGGIKDLTKLFRGIEFGDFHIKVENGVVVCTETTETDKV